MAQIATFYDHIADVAAQEGMSLAEAMGEARALGVELVEAAQNIVVGHEDEVGRTLSAAGLRLSTVPAWFAFGQDADVEQQALPVLESARYLGASGILVIPGFFRPEDGPEERLRRSEQIAGCIRRLAELTDRYGLFLVMEDFDNALSPCASKDQLRFFLDRCPELSCCFDTGNFRFSAEDELEAYELLKDRVGYVHLKDRAYAPLNGEGGLPAADGKALYPCPVGAGGLRMEELVSRLKADGYGGPWTVEHYGAAKALDYLTRSVEWLKKQLS